MEPKNPKPGSKELDSLELTLTQDIELPFDDEGEPRTGDEPFDAPFEEEDFEEAL